jgi:hypothetical protein
VVSRRRRVLIAENKGAARHAMKYASHKFDSLRWFSKACLQTSMRSEAKTEMLGNSRNIEGGRVVLECCTRKTQSCACLYAPAQQRSSIGWG